MSDNAQYDYSFGNRLSDRNTYFYTKFGGEKFLAAWQASRAAAIAELGGPRRTPAPARQPGAPPSTGEVDTRAVVDYLIAGQACVDEPWLDRLIQRVEVSKRVYRTYQWTERGLRAVRESGFDDLELYLSAGTVFDRAYQHTGRLQCLNALLKIDDTLISVRADLSADQRAVLARLLTHERDHVTALAAKLGVSW